MVLGVDPGARSTGFVIVDTATRRCISHCTAERSDRDPLLPVPAAYRREVHAAFYDMWGPAHVDTVVAVEMINRPSWHMRGRAAANPEALLACAVVLGTVLAIASGLTERVLEVEPGRNGSAPLGAYPDVLVSDAERRGAGWQLRVGTGALRHCRSAFDVAMQAPLLLRATAHH